MVFNIRCTVRNTHSHILNIFHSIELRSGTLVAFNATMYNATISQAIPMNTVILSVGLITNRSATGMTETYSISTTSGFSQPAAVPYSMRFTGENRGQLFVHAKIGRNQVTDIPYKSDVLCELTGSSISLTADLEVRVVEAIGE